MKGFFNYILGQVWTLLGMFVAWVVLDGSAKIVVGYAIILTSIIWVITYWFRKHNE